ncbi:hypothetical protein D3C78_687590 [compost metagenome]
MQTGQLFFGIAPCHQGDRLVEYIHHRGQLLAVTQRGADIDDDGQINAHVPGHIHGYVVDHAAVHQQAPIKLDRGEHRRDRHAGADHLGQVAAAEYHLLAAGDVGCHGAERYWQLVEIAGIGGVGQLAFQQQCEVLALNHPKWQAKAAVVSKTQLLLDQKIAVILLAPEGHVLARWGIGQRLLPVERSGEFFQLLDAVAGRIQAANHRAHAGAGDGVDAHALFLQGLEHADVGQATGSAPGEYQADLGACRLGEHGERAERQQKAEQQAAHRESQTGG